MAIKPYETVVIFFLFYFLFINLSSQEYNVIGFYSNESSDDGEHSYGYSLYLWQNTDRIIGLFSFHAGLIGDATSNIISNVKKTK